MEPQIVAALIGAGSTTIIFVTGLSIKALVRNSRNGHGSNGSNGKARFCDQHHVLVNKVVETATNVQWLKEQHEKDNTKEILHEIKEAVNKK